MSKQRTTTVLMGALLAFAVLLPVLGIRTLPTPPPLRRRSGPAG